MPASQAVLDLIDRFERNREACKSPSYNETQLRREFLDPFSEAKKFSVHIKEDPAPSSIQPPPVSGQLH